ncbi:conserved hypothetical protein [Culex quinquefasciatus]|uniref:Neurotransmitter-gated ion-channel ligand-binding domain-containing protein n=1 Tax=Culex quinquefasciatus TaxID=7176 RepID=B0WWW7_CULQU|nr:conserved hypothetical protein [Culex quinquefasciatus]|eukprot:XP_001861889.1 conserved hypothetical protein [Culex quinquefasciatus]
MFLDEESSQHSIPLLLVGKMSTQRGTRVENTSPQKHKGTQFSGESLLEPPVSIFQFPQEPFCSKFDNKVLVLLNSEKIMFHARDLVCLAGYHEKRLLHDLLDTYNTLERPVVNESDPLQLSFGLTLMQIIDVVSKLGVVVALLRPLQMLRNQQFYPFPDVVRKMHLFQAANLMRERVYFSRFRERWKRKYPLYVHNDSIKRVSWCMIRDKSYPIGQSFTQI